MSLRDLHALDPRLPFLLFPVMWIAMSGLLAYFGGWASLASRFAAEIPKHGVTFRFESGAVGRGLRTIGYRNSLTVTLLPEGLGLSVFFLFRFATPPLVIPWSEVSSITEERGLFSSSFTIQLRNHWAKLSLHGDAGRVAQSMYESRETLDSAAPPVHG